MKYSEVYNKAADVVEKGWTQGAFARDEQGNIRASKHRRAVSWCLSGALFLVFNPQFGLRSYKKIRNYLGISPSLSVWNDDLYRTQKEVVKLLRETAKRADRENKTYG